MNKIILIVSMVLGTFYNYCNAQWVPVTQNHGTTIKCFASMGDTVLAGGKEKFYLSVNGGATWVNANIGFTQSDVDALFIYDNKIFAGTNGGTSIGGVFVTNNKGNSWKALKTNFPSYITSLGATSSKIFAGTAGSGLYASSDTGATWTPVNIGVNNADIRTLVVKNDTIYVGTKSANGVYQSTDNGTTWTNPMTGLNHTEIYSFAISGNYVYAGTGYYLFATNNGGVSWTRMGTNISGTINSVTSDGSKVLVCTSSGKVYISTDNATFTEISTGLPTAANSFNGKLHISSNAFYIGMEPVISTNGACGISKSTNNGTSWTKMNIGLISKVNNLFANNGSLFAGTKMGAAISSDNGNQWTEINNTISRNVLNFATNGTSIFAGTTGGIYKTNDNGTNWTYLNSSSNSNVGVYITDSVVYNVIQDQVKSSTDNGSTWTTCALPNTTLFVSFAASGKTAYLGTYNAGVLRTTNYGKTWNAVNNGINTSSQYFAVATDGTNAYASPVGSGIYKSTDNGANWTAINTGLPAGVTAYTILIVGTKLFIGTFSGEVFYSNNSGASWINISSGLLGSIVYTLTSDGTNVYAGTASNGIFKRPLSELSTAQSVPQSPANLSATTLSNTEIKLAWADVSTNEDHYIVERSTTLDGPWTQVASLPSNTINYTNSGLTPETFYLYRIYATNAGGSSAYSNMVGSTTLSGAVTNNGLNKIDALKSSKNFLYPNPTSGNLNLNLSNESIVKIIDFLGKTVYENNKVNAKETIQLQHLPEGVYIFTYTENANSYSQKLIISK